jgi:apolipoprotein N-acyltransferase
MIFLATATFDLWPLAWFALVPLLVAIRDATPRRAFGLGTLCGVVTNAGGFYWINGLLERFGHMPFYAALPLFALLVTYQGLLFGLFALGVRRLGEHFPVTLVAPLTMVALELVYWLIFPWYYAITQAWVTPVIQVAELGGPLAVTFVLVLVNGALYDLLTIRPRPWRRALAAGLVVAASVGFGLVRIAQVRAGRAAAPKLKVGLVQANFGILEGRRRRLAQLELATERRLSAELEAQGAELVVWPESAYPYWYDRAQTEDYSDERQTVSRGLHIPLIIGALTQDADAPYPYNSALLVQPGGHLAGRFDKNYLLLFGEYIPFYESIPWFKRWVPEASNLARGRDVTAFPVGPYRVAPMICYEDIIPRFGRRLAALHPQLFVNITNDAWFGRTSEPWQHLALAVFRAVEHRVDLVRAVNTGVSAFIDATGRVYRQSDAVDPELTPGQGPVTLLDEVAMVEAHGLYGVLGDSFGYADALALAALAVVAWRRARAARRS